VGFLVTGAVAAPQMMLGAAGAAIVAVVLIEAIRRLGRIEPGAAMGVVFTAMFAGGVLLLEQSDTSNVHLDVEHALFGNLESLIWLDATGWASLADPQALAGLPPELGRVALALLAISLFVFVLWRPLKIATFDEGFAATMGMFDEGFAATMGIPVGILGIALVVVAAIAAVAAFDAVGSIIVIAMFICPPAAARLMTNRLEAQVAWSVAFAALSAILGYVLAGYGPLWFGGTNAVSAAGMIATVSGLILALAALFGPCRKRAGAPAGT
jgi:manganese/zinc/iron transport system permease protein